MRTIFVNAKVSISYFVSVSHGLEVWTVSVNNINIATHMSERGARTHIERLAKKLAM
jgi:hypothetical protein